MTNPALTAEEWATFPDWPAAKASPNPDDLPLYYPTRHGAAAANLHGQPFGFTQEDVHLLLRGSDAIVSIAAEGYGDQKEANAASDRLDYLASRIAALLPPQP